ncbi:hypothetical protein [Aeromonas veronii]
MANSTASTTSPNGLVVWETGFDGRTTAYRYDLNGHLSEKVEFGKQES